MMSASGLLVSYVSRQSFHNMDFFESTTTSVTGGTLTRVYETQDGIQRTDTCPLPGETYDRLKGLVSKAQRARPEKRYRDTGDGPQANSSLHRTLQIKRMTIAIEDGAQFPDALAEIMGFLSALSCSPLPPSGS